MSIESKKCPDCGWPYLEIDEYIRHLHNNMCVTFLKPTQVEPDKLNRMWGDFEKRQRESGSNYDASEALNPSEAKLEKRIKKILSLTHPTMDPGVFAEFKLAEIRKLLKKETE